jgi:hypothetical protein
MLLCSKTSKIFCESFRDSASGIVFTEKLQDIFSDAKDNPVHLHFIEQLYFGAGRGGRIKRAAQAEKRS